MINPLFNAQDDEWVVMVGRYMLNMGAIEMATRLLIARIEGTDKNPIFRDDLAARLGFVRRRFPRQNKERHKWAMNALEVAGKHAAFRNIVAHGPLAISEQPDGSYQIHGILNVMPKGIVTAELVSLAEITGRVNESAVVARQLLEMQSDFPATTGA
jgi:hypothetical protein